MAFVSCTENFVKTTKKTGVQLANREINQQKQELIKKWDVKAILSDSLVVVAFVIFLTFVRPFGMHEIAFWYAGIFWLIMCFSGYVIYSPTIYFLSKWLSNSLPESLNNAAVRLLVSTCVASGIMALFAPFIINLFFGSFQNYWQSLPMSFLACFFIGGFISGVSFIKTMLFQQRQQLQQNTEQLAQQNEQVESIQKQPALALINELPLDKRGQLICLQMDDHYLNIMTDKGDHLLLMRFKDALTKLESYDGFQTHRSWWVAKDAVASSKKEGRKLILVMINGTEVPVSQTYLANTKSVLGIK